LADQHGIEFVYRTCAYLPLLGIVAAFLPNIERRNIERALLFNFSHYGLSFVALNVLAESTRLARAGGSDAHRGRRASPRMAVALCGVVFRVGSSLACSPIASGTG